MSTFNTNNLQADSYIRINTGTTSVTNPERILIHDGVNNSFSNIFVGRSSAAQYAQLNIHNTSGGTMSSADIVATADNGSESINYIDMGINSSTFNGFVGFANDGYLYSTGNNLLIGNTTSNKNIQFFTDGMNTRMSISSGQTLLTVPLTATSISATSVYYNNYGVEHFGDGSDGNVTISANTTLSRTMYYNNLTVSGSATVLTTAGYKIYVKGTFINSGITGSIGTNGGNGGNGTVGAAGAAGSAGAALAIAEFLASTAGGAGALGGAITPGVGANGNATGTQNSMLNNSGGAAAAGGAASGGTAGGTGVAAGATTLFRPVRVLTHTFSFGVLAVTTGRGGAGGGGGGGATTGGGGGGGGGGAAPHPVPIYANTILNFGKIRSVGGNGGNGGNAFVSSSGGGGGAGGGACGGLVYLVYKNLTNSGNIIVSGGTAGTSGSGMLGGANGGATASSGTTGSLLTINLTSNVITLT